LNISALPTAIAAKQDLISTVNPLGTLYLSHTFSGTTSVHSVNTNSSHLLFDNNRLALFSECSGAGNLVDSLHGYALSLGTTSVSTGFSSGFQQFRPDPKKHVFGVYESQGTGLNPSQSAGQEFSGMGLVDANGMATDIGLGIWGATGTDRPCLIASVSNNASVAPAGEKLPAIFIKGGNIGIHTTIPSKPLDIIGDTFVTGNLASSNKTFDIKHVDEARAKDNWRIRHWCVESDDSGGTLFYRRQVQAVQGNNVLEMPSSWFSGLAQDVLCYASPVRHFGLCWADLDTSVSNKVILGASKAGLYNVLITARRADSYVMSMPPEDLLVEYQSIPNTAP